MDFGTVIQKKSHLKLSQFQIVSKYHLVSGFIFGYNSKRYFYWSTRRHFSLKCCSSGQGMLYRELIVTTFQKTPLYSVYWPTMPFAFFDLFRQRAFLLLISNNRFNWISIVIINSISYILIQLFCSNTYHRCH